MENWLRHPFGEMCCEFEREILKQDYHAYYFNEAPFNQLALQPESYLLVGRRGTGKTSLCEYFKFQQILRDSRCIDVDEPEAYFRVLEEFSNLAGRNSDMARMRLTKVWEYLIWCLIFETYEDKDPIFRTALEFSDQKSRPGRMLHLILRGLSSKFLDDKKGELVDELEAFIGSDLIERAKRKVLEVVKKEPVIVALDTLERYDPDSEGLMLAISALIQTANDFNIRYAYQGIHIKAFVADEVFPHIAVSEVANTAKFIRDPIYLHWRPKDMVKLTSWRFFLYLKQNDLIDPNSVTLDWNKFPEVHDKLWLPYFGQYVVNKNGLKERTFPYVLRHTQMRPRQLIIILNKIARKALNDRSFPYFSNELIRDSIDEVEMELANEVINSYAQIHKGLGRILDALSGTPIKFRGNWLDKIAKRTASSWPIGEYSPYKFKTILTELGIVGRVRHHDPRTNIIKADFEYHLKDRLVVHSEEDYVLHPLFNRKFNASNPDKLIVYPFPDNPDFQEV